MMGGREHEHSNAKSRLRSLCGFILLVQAYESEFQMNYVNQPVSYTCGWLLRNVWLTACPFEFLDIAAYGKSDFIFEKHAYYILLS